MPTIPPQQTVEASQMIPPGCTATGCPGNPNNWSLYLSRVFATAADPDTAVAESSDHQFPVFLWWNMGTGVVDKINWQSLAPKGKKLYKVLVYHQSNPFHVGTETWRYIFVHQA